VTPLRRSSYIVERPELGGVILRRGDDEVELCGRKRTGSHDGRLGTLMARDPRHLLFRRDIPHAGGAIVATGEHAGAGLIECDAADGWWLSILNPDVHKHLGCGPLA